MMQDGVLNAVDPLHFSNTRLKVPRTELPEGAELGDELGCGANNRVFEIEWSGEQRALRVPRRKSETQHADAARIEARYTIMAANAGVAPKLHAIWYARHARARFPSGLYLVTDLYERTLDDAMIQDETREVYLENVEEIGNQILSHISALARNRLLCTDLKPTNVLVSGLDDDDDDDDDDAERSVDVKLIDFGREFCEHASDAIDRRAPTIDFLTALVKSKEPDLSSEEHAAVVEHVLFALMLVTFSAVTTKSLHADRHQHRLSKSMRARVHPLSARCSKYLAGLQGKHRAYLRAVMRTDEVRDVLSHYHGRRNAGTRRTLRYAVGAEN